MLGICINRSWTFDHKSLEHSSRGIVLLCMRIGAEGGQAQQAYWHDSGSFEKGNHLGLCITFANSVLRSRAELTGCPFVSLDTASQKNSSILVPCSMPV